MNGLIFLVILVLIYYFINKYQELSHTTNMYIIGGLLSYSVYLIIYYFYPQLIYKAFKEIYETHKKPLYDYSHYSKYKKEDISYKHLLHSKQGGRCYQCVNFIVGSETENCYIDVKDTNEMVTIHNMKLLCPNCYHKSRIV